MPVCFVHQLADLKTDTNPNLWLHKLMSKTLKTTSTNILMTTLVSLAQATMMKSQVDVVTFQSQRLTQPKFENAEVKIRRRFHHQIGIGTSRHHNLVSHFFCFALVLFLLCILASFWVLRATKSWSKYFIGCLQIFEFLFLCLSYSKMKKVSFKWLLMAFNIQTLVDFLRGYQIFALKFISFLCSFWTFASKCLIFPAKTFV